MTRAAAVVFMVVLVPVVASADPPPPSSAGEQKAAKTSRRLEITPQREAAAIDFAQQHHPELAKLLLHLKQELPKEYDKAVRDLYRTQNRLKGIQSGDQERYQLELQLWTVRSRAQLLSARIQMNPSESLRRKLRQALNEEYDVRQRILQRERDRLARRLDKLDAQLEQLQQNRGQLLERQFSSLTAPSKKKGRKATKTRATRPARKKTVQ